MRKIFTILLVCSMLSVVQAQDSELIISEYVEGWSNNKALELYNPTDFDADLSEFRLIRYSNGDDVPPAKDEWTIDLPEVILPPYHTFVIAIDQRNPDGSGQTAPVWSQLQQRADVFLCPDYNVSETMYFNGDDAIVIEKDEGAGEYIIHDIFGRWGPPAPALAQFVGSDKEDNAWTNVAPYVTGEGVAITGEHTMIRKSAIFTGVTTNPALFNPLADWDTLPANTFYQLGWHEFDNASANETPVLTNEKLTIAVSPSATNGTEVVTFAATDNEQDELKYYIDYGNFIYVDDVRIEPFELDKATGVLTLVDEAGLVPEVLDTFNITLNITDGFSQLGPVYVRLVVTDSVVNVSNEIVSSLKVYPNPVKDDQFRVSSDKSIQRISITNMLGQTIKDDIYANPVFDQHISLMDAKNGVYILNVNYIDGSFETRKILLN